MLTNKLKFQVSFLLVSLSLTGCLKSRIQLRDDPEEKEAAKSVPTKVEPVQPPGQYALDELRGEMTRMQGRIEDLERSKQDPQTVNAQKEQTKKIETRIAELEQSQLQMIEALKKLQESQAVAAAAAEAPEAFDKAKSQFDAKNYDAAIDLFSSYLKNSKAPRAEEATFYRGEAYFAVKQYKKAIVDYSKFPEKYTRSKHMPVVLYKIGVSFDALGMKDDARGFYQEVAEKFPKSAEAKKAKAKVK